MTQPFEAEGFRATGAGFFARDPEARDPAEPVGTLWERLGHDFLDRPAIATFEDTARRRNEAVACDDGSLRLTYGRLLHCAGPFAAAIHAAPGAGRPAVVMMTPGSAFGAILLGLLGTDRTWCVFDPAWPAERQKAVLDEVRPGLVILSVQHPADLSAFPADLPRLALDVDNPGTGVRPEIAIDLDRPRTIVFTSGSTGRPKGFVWSERGLLAFARNFINAFHLNPSDRVFSFGMPALGGVDWLNVAISGAAMRIVDFRKAGMPGVLAALPSVTILSFIPSILRSIMATPGIEAQTSALRILYTWGEPMLAADLELFRSKVGPDCLVGSGMGTTEAGLLFVWFARDDAVTDVRTPVGYLTDGTSLKIADAAGSTAPAGQRGELVVRSRYLALGAFQDGAITQGPFQTDPDDPSIRIYATGDLAVIRADGLAEVYGRIDRMVKIRGLQVDLGVVEAAIREFAGITDVVAFVASRQGQPARVVAAVVPVEGKPVDEVALRRHVIQASTDHMAPAQFLVLDRIRRLPNHKPDLMFLEAMANG